MSPTAQKRLKALIAVTVPVAFLPLIIGWDMARLLLIGLAAVWVVQTTILFLARSKIGLAVVVIGSVFLVFLLARHDPVAAGTAVGFAVLSTLPSLQKKKT
jgi:hypothetical protein